VTTPHDPATDPETEGIPDLQDGTPEQQRASDPQQASVPGDTPTAVEGRTTPREVREGESLDERLAKEEPEPEPPATDGKREEPTGLLYDAPDAERPREQDGYAQEGSTSGLSAEEEAVRVATDDRRP
jgi:hypothetical protein